MMLNDLHPRMIGEADDGVLIFDCPNARQYSTFHHSVRVPLGGIVGWQATGRYPDRFNLNRPVKCTLSTCGWRGTVQDGRVDKVPARG